MYGHVDKQYLNRSTAPDMSRKYLKFIQKAISDACDLYATIAPMAITLVTVVFRVYS